MAKSDEERLRQLEERERTIKAQKQQIKARMAAKERARRTHALIELGAGIETELHSLTIDAFTGGKDEIGASRDRLHRTLNRRVVLSDGQTLTVAAIIDHAWQLAEQPKTPAAKTPDGTETPEQTDLRRPPMHEPQQPTAGRYKPSKEETT